MNIIEEKIQALSDFENNIGSYVREVIEDNEDVIISMNADEQLYNYGITSTGVNIDSFAPYSAKTIGIKEQKGQPTDRVTLRDTGDFHNSFYVVATDVDFSIEAANDKTEKLKFMYGDDILGLTTENMNDLSWNYLQDALIIKLKLVL